METQEFIGFIVIILAFCAGYIYREIKLIKELVAINSGLKKELQKQDDSVGELGLRDITKLKHEIISGIHYFYEETGDTFVAQGKTLEEAAKHYTSLKGKDILGWFQHPELNKNFCFVNNQCMEFRNE